MNNNNCCCEIYFEAYLVKDNKYYITRIIVLIYFNVVRFSCCSCWR